MKENDPRFNRLKELGHKCGFLGVSWDTSKEGIIIRICFDSPEEVEKPVSPCGSSLEDSVKIREVTE